MDGITGRHGLLGCSAVTARSSEECSAAARGKLIRRAAPVADYIGDMRIAILTFDGFNEIDSFVASYMINRAAPPGWKAEITCASPVVESGRGVRVSAQQPLEFAREADAVVVGSGKLTARLVEDGGLLSRLSLDPGRQLVASQCSGALMLARLGMLEGLPACTDRQ